jgi:DeoR/GlpR family transcriptional regulator of sugar metabolism
VTKLIGPQRQTTILETLRQQGAVSIHELSQTLGVSAMTIRRDLDELERRGLLKRTYGGAVAATSVSFDPPFTQRQQIQKSVKQAIAQQAATLIEKGDRLILDSGSTVATLCPYLGDRPDLTVITYSIPVLHGLTRHADIALICTGGSFDNTINAFVGPLAEQVLENVRVDKAFLGATSISVKDGFSNSHLQNLTLQRLALRCARETYLLADSSKFLRDPFWIVANLEAITGIITDRSVPPESVNRLIQNGIQVQVV